MTKLEVCLGDCIFLTGIDFQSTAPATKWQDTTHFHVDNEIHIILNGSALVEINGKEVEMKTGDVCMLAPRSSHYPKTYSEPFEKINFSFRIVQNNGNKSKSFSEYEYYSNIFGSVSEHFIINDLQISDIAKRLFWKEFSARNEHIYKVMFSLFFISLAKRIKESQPLYRQSVINSISESENSFVQRKTVEEFFQTRYNEEISIEDLANELCLSVSHTHRIVKKVFNEGFKKTLTKQRMEHACMLIKQGDLPLNEIAFLCGYTSYNGFLSAFKGYMGKKPKEYGKASKQ